MLTAKGDETDRIAGLDIGADDYLPKPFNPRELVARINAVMRRQSPASALPGCSRREQRRRCDSAHSKSILPPHAHPQRQACRADNWRFAMLKTLVTHPHNATVARSLDGTRPRSRVRRLDRSIDVQVSRLRDC